MTTRMTRNANAWCLLVVALAALVSGCAEENDAKPPPPPPPTYSGPEFLRTTIGSMTTLRGYQPILVSGYGLVVGLEGTGSPDVPPGMREWLIEQMRKKGFGSANTGMPGPERVLASNTAAIVLIEGIIPPGATEGTRFDLLVRALPETQTTSLEGGMLYSTDLRIGGSNFGAAQLNTVASGRGPIFLNPFVQARADEKTNVDNDPRVGRVLAGGMVTTDTAIQLVLFQESYRLTTQIANRINARFPQSPDDKGPVATAMDASVVQIAVPNRYKDNVRDLLEVVSRMYLNPTAAYNQEKALELGKMIEDPANRKFVNDAAWAWEGMGKSVLPTVRNYYTHEDQAVRLAALQAGARLDDVRAADGLLALARAEKPGISERATALLGHMVRTRPDNQRAAVMLRQLLDSDDAVVRMEAMDALWAIKDPTVQGNQFPDKVEVLRVQSRKPMIYVTRSGIPRIAVFDERLAFNQPTMFATADNRFMVRTEAQQPSAAVFYMPPGTSRAVKENIPSNVAYLVGMMAFKPGENTRSTGLNMSYSQIVSALYQMTRDKHIGAPFVLQQSNIIESITSQRAAERAIESRPESSGETGRRENDGTRPVTDVPKPPAQN